jgi:hypothetical protein
MRKQVFVSLLCGGALAAGASASVIINEVFSNPPGSFDSTREYIELLGTPGMKLDGYAIANIFGTLNRFYPLGSIPPAPVAQEIDEFFSLDGLQLGRNGLLVVAVSIPTNYSTVLADTNFQRWTTLYNGGLDTNGQLENDGSKTVMLIRHRPGATQADPGNPAGLRWGKDIVVDGELVTPVVDPQDGISKDQFGDGGIDIGDPNNFGGQTLDLRGASTLADISDDLEVVDEVSYEQDRGWEYDVDGRIVDLGGSTIGGLPERRVHALDDPQGFTPDVLTRVDYRTKGPGWTPAPGATGALPNGNNWQDTATEQWIRGETVVGTSGEGSSPWFFFDNSANADPDAIQPYLTTVPLWLNDGVGTDYNFTTPFTYQVMPGRINPLAVPFIPGDVDRDGDADADDIAKLAAVFGNADWIFSNSFALAPEGNAGDPAAQTRPWDLDGTGDNGIEPSDLQWTLNFQGNTNGRIVGRQYDSTTPSAVGVYLNPHLPVVCTITTNSVLPPGRTLTTLQVGDVFDIIALGQVTGGAIVAADQQNGIMQFVNDVTLSTGGVLRATNIQPAGTFTTTRAAIQQFAGASGDLGVRSANGYTTSFTSGLAAAVQLYRVTFQALAQGSTNIAFSPATAPRLAASTPQGLKVGHTDNNGTPGAAAYPVLLATVVAGGGCPHLGCEEVDLDGDCQITIADLSLFLSMFGSSNPAGDFDNDGSVGLADLTLLLSRFGLNCQ